MKVERLSKRQYKEAFATGGYRERYALKNGTAQLVTVNGDKCYKFTYPVTNDYQGANGATYNTRRKTWID